MGDGWGSPLGGSSLLLGGSHGLTAGEAFLGLGQVCRIGSSLPSPQSFILYFCSEFSENNREIT